MAAAYIGLLLKCETAMLFHILKAVIAQKNLFCNKFFATPNQNASGK